MVDGPQTNDSSTVRPSDVCVVTVTYGDRAHLCLAAVKEALGQGVGRVVIVSNGATASSVAELSAFAGRQQRGVDLLELPDNIGSAGGFSTGLRHAIEQTTYPYVWLLDDDNVAVEGALAELLDWRKSLAILNASPDIVVFAVRPATPLMAALLRGVSPARVYPSRGGFAGFNVVDIPRKLVRRIFAGFGRRPLVTDPIEIPYGPYGGMLLPRSLLSVVGYPNEQLVLYEDDADYTRRLHDAGAKLFVVPAAIVEELDARWYTTARGRTPFGRALSAQSDARVYFSLRNRVYFENTFWSGARPLYLFNKLVYITTVWLLGHACGRPERARLVIDAVCRGEKKDFEVGESLTLA